MTLLVMVAAGRLAASHLGLDKDATALSLFGLPRSQEIISMPPPCGFCLRSIIIESMVHASPGVAFHDRPLNFHPREADESGFEPGRCVSVPQNKTHRQI